MMKVAFDVGPLNSGHGVRGIGYYVRNLSNALAELEDKEVNISLVDFAKADLDKYDLVHYPYFRPFHLDIPYRRDTQIVVTIHDLIPLVYPNIYQPGIKGRMRFEFQKRLIRNVGGIIVDSETTKKDVVRFLGIDSDKIWTVYLAHSPQFKVIKDRKFLLNIKKKYSLPDKYVLYVGDVNYNKNLLTLFSASHKANFDVVVCGKQARDLDSILANNTPGVRDLVRRYLGVAHPEVAHYKKLKNYFDKNAKILRLGFVPDFDMPAIYNLASVYCQPSYYEGFGLPVLEAMASGVPVLSSRTQALVEISGNNCIYFNPEDANDLVAKLDNLWKKPKERDKFVEKGLSHVKKFSWKKTAEKTMEVYKNAIE